MNQFLAKYCYCWYQSRSTCPAPDKSAVTAGSAALRTYPAAGREDQKNFARLDATTVDGGSFLFKSTPDTILNVIPMKKQNIILALLLSAVLFWTGAGTAAARPTIKEIRFESSAPGTDQVIFRLNGPHLPSTFALMGERPRVVFDFPDTVPTKAVHNSIDADGRYVKRIRTGIHRGKNAKTRVVLDLVSNDPVDFKQDFDTTTNILVISVFAQGTEPPETAEEARPEPAPEAGTAPETDIPTAPHAAGPAPSAATTGEPEQPEPGQALSPDSKPEPAATPEPPVQAEMTGPTATPSAVPDEQDEATVIQPLAEIGEIGSKDTGQPTLSSIEFDRESNRGEMILFKLNAFNPPVVFGIEDEIPRVVCFFKGTRAGEQLQDIINSDGRFVKTIRVGKYRDPDNIRVVLDLEPGRNYDLQQVFFRDDMMFMIIINTAGEKQNAQ